MYVDHKLGEGLVGDAKVVAELGGYFRDEGEELEGFEVVHRVGLPIGLVRSPSLERMRWFGWVWIELVKLI